MHKYTPIVILLLISGYGLYNATLRSSDVDKIVSRRNTPYTKHTETHPALHFVEALETLQSDKYLQRYIVDVINHGSDQLHFKKEEVMEAGFAPKKDAKEIACYVMSLSGRACEKPYVPEVVGLFTSNCGGCHGNDGKGLGGTYPNLTRGPLLGIVQREAHLRSRVAP